MSTDKAENAETLQTEWKPIIDNAIQYLQTCKDNITEDSYWKLLEIDRVLFDSGSNQKDILKYLLDNGYCQLFGKIWNALSGYLVKDKWGTVGFEILNAMLLSFMNLTDASADISAALMALDCIPLLFEGLQSLSKYLNQEDDFLHKIIGNILGILQNSIRLNPTERLIYRNADAIPILKKYLETPNMEIKTDSLLILAYTVDETESNVLAKEGVLRFLVDLFKTAVESENHQVDVESGTYSAMELLQGLNLLAVNDNNKREIQQQDGLIAIIRMLKTDFSEDEQREAVKALWNLAFVDSIRESSLVQDTIESLEALVTSSSKSLQDACNYALWEIRGGKSSSAAGREQRESPQCAEQTTAKPAGNGQIMISYQWGCQKRALDIKERLTQYGFKVWMDVDDMRGDILSSMADAVQKSDVILICMTERYKDSQSCRSEATYAYKLQKKLIPLLMEPNYKPDGWLGVLQGMDLYYELHSDDQLEANIRKLLTVIRENISSCEDAMDGPIQPVQQDVYSTTSPCSSRTVSDWTTNDVQTWLQDNKLTELCKSLDFCDGNQLEVLQDHYCQSPKDFKDDMRSDFQMSSKTYLMFAGALKKLFRK